MTERQISVIPPFDLVQKWMHELMFSGIPHPDHGKMDSQPHWLELVEKVAQYGADQELEACCEWFDRYIPGYEGVVDRLRTARRPKPPSLADVALETLQRISKNGYPCNYQDNADWDIIIRALEQLKQLEGEIDLFATSLSKIIIE